MLARMITVAIALLIAVTPARAADKDNLKTFRDVQRQVLQYPHFTIFDSVDAQIDHGVVTLTGKVTMPYKRDDIAKRVSKVASVKEVRNQITVLPVSQFDDDLRVRIARAIYGNGNFRPYAFRANPPIHIIVEHGRVTLEGVVSNRMDSQLAYTAARQVPGVFQVTNNLRVENER